MSTLMSANESFTSQFEPQIVIRVIVKFAKKTMQKCEIRLRIPSLLVLGGIFPIFPLTLRTALKAVSPVCQYEQILTLNFKMFFRGLCPELPY